MASEKEKMERKNTIENVKKFITVNVKIMTPKHQKAIKIEEKASIKEFKAKICSEFNDTSIEQLILLFEGKVLKDNETLKSRTITDNATVHLVIKPRATSSAGGVSSSAEPQAAMSKQANATGGFFAIANMAMDIVKNNPTMLQDIIQSPMTQNLMSNPELMKSLIPSNPQFPGSMDSNPELSDMFKLLNSPLLRDTMEEAKHSKWAQDLIGTTANHLMSESNSTSSQSKAKASNTASAGTISSNITDSTDIEVATATNRAMVNDQQDEDETFETPRSSPEIMVTDHPSPDRIHNGEMDVDVRQSFETKSEPVNISNSVPKTPLIDTPNVQNSELNFPSELLPRSQGIDMVVGREPWHRQVPPEWVPIITRDVQGQQQIPPLAPYSDAYLSTQPAKKRRLAEAKKPEGSIEKVISETLKDAIKVSGVHPKSSQSGTSTGGIAANSSIAVEVAKDGGVQAAVKGDTRGAIKRRLQRDPDFKPERFPDSQDFATKK